MLFEHALSPEDAVARIRQTREGFAYIALGTCWRQCHGGIYVLTLVLYKIEGGLSFTGFEECDVEGIPESRKSSYVKTANELVITCPRFQFTKHLGKYTDLKRASLGVTVSLLSCDLEVKSRGNNLQKYRVRMCASAPN